MTDVRLVELDEDNWLAYAGLAVRDEQKTFLAPAIGILARGYVYRSCRAHVWGIEADGEAAGLALVRDFDEEPVCYDLQQFMVDARFQGRGIGTAALDLILTVLAKEKRFAFVEVCVHKEARAARRVYEKAGFTDTGYVDASLPECLNLRRML